MEDPQHLGKVGTAFRGRFSWYSLHIIALKRTIVLPTSLDAWPTCAWYVASDGRGECTSKKARMAEQPMGSTQHVSSGILKIAR